MTLRALATFAVLLSPGLSLAQQPLKVGAVQLGAPKAVSELDADRLKGQPAKLAWSADGKELYLQVLEGDFGKNGAVRHYTVTLGDGKQKSIDAEPAWANAYWAAKSGQASPDDAAFKVGVESGQRVERSVSAQMGGDLARGGVGGGGDIGGGAGGTSAGDAIANAANAQSVMVHSLKLAGETIGEFVNSVIVPGLTFAWGPSGSKAVIFAQPKGGKLVIMDSAKKKQEIDGTKDAILPAFSADGSKLAWIRKDGRKKYSLLVADVSAR